MTCILKMLCAVKYCQPELSYSELLSIIVVLHWHRSYKNCVAATYFLANLCYVWLCNLQHEAVFTLPNYALLSRPGWIFPVFMFHWYFIGGGLLYSSSLLFNEGRTSSSFTDNEWKSQFSCLYRPSQFMMTILPSSPPPYQKFSCWTPLRPFYPSSSSIFNEWESLILMLQLQTTILQFRGGN